MQIDYQTPVNRSAAQRFGALMRRRWQLVSILSLVALLLLNAFVFKIGYGGSAEDKAEVQRLKAENQKMADELQR
jgi:uncharacterized membrane protein (DUF485 family)